MSILKALGTAAEAATKVTSLVTTLNQGIAQVTTNLKESAATLKINKDSDGAVSYSNAASSSEVSSGIQHFLNPLENFASYAPLWTFAVLTPQQFNDPKSYRNNKQVLDNIVFSSGGRYDEKRVRTSSGAPEFYVDNFQMNAFLAPSPRTGNSNAINFSWEIYEPYSMGLLLESMQIAAINAGYANYMDNCPYLLRLDFQGYDETGNTFKGGPALTKYYVCKLKKVTFDVNEQGSVYKVEAIPYNHMGFSSLINTTFSDINLEGGSVREVLVTGEKSLVNILNRKQELLVKERKQDIEDTYSIWFPQSALDNPPPPPPTALSRAIFEVGSDGKRTIAGFDPVPPQEFGGNAIGLSSLDYDIKSGGTYPHSQEGDAYDQATGILDRGSVKLSPTARTMMFTQGQTITQMITSVILNSKYVYSVFDEARQTPTGEVFWFKVDVQIQLKEFDPCRGDFAKHIIYRVIPYKVHSSVFSAPGAVPPGYKQLTKKIVKNYNYIYTGKNQDIIKFDLQFNNMFFTGTRPSAENNNRSIVNRGAQNAAGESQATTEINCDTKKEGLTARMGTAPLGKALSSSGDLHPNGTSSVQQQVAQQFQDAFLQGGSGDMIKANMEILGDTYYLVDSGLCNYFAKEYQDGINADGTMTYDGSDVYIYVTFRTPIDSDPDKGLFNFKGTAVSPFSGIFKIIKVVSNFKDGRFTQTLELTRMQKQPSDFEGGVGKDPDKRPFVVVPADVEKPPTEGYTE